MLLTSAGPGPDEGGDMVGQFQRLRAARLDAIATTGAKIGVDHGKPLAPVHFQRQGGVVCKMHAHLFWKG